MGGRGRGRDGRRAGRGVSDGLWRLPDDRTTVGAMATALMRGRFGMLLAGQMVVNLHHTHTHWK